MTITFIFIAALLIVLYILLMKFLVLPHDAKEPPLILPTIPIFGHLFGMLQYGSRYYSMITNRCRLPIYTLNLPFSKVYIINSPQLIPMVDRHAKTISFAPCVVQFAKRILVPSTEAIQKLEEDLLEEEPVPCLRQETLEVMHKNLAAGEGLESSTKEIVRSLDRIFKSRRSDETEKPGEEVDLFAWTRSMVTVASTDGVYGVKHNPFREDDVQNAFWVIDNDFALLGLGVFPSAFAPKGAQGRKKFFKAFNNYYDNDGQAAASKVIQARYELNRNAAISIDDIAHFDLAVCYGTLVNTVPGASWALCYLYSDSKLLADVRDMVFEATEDLAFQQAKSVHAHRQVNIATVAARCPLLQSLVRETLRVQSTNAAARIVLKDTVLDKRYLIKKDALLFIPSEDVHNNKSVWGPTAKTFDARRFLAENKASSKIPAAAYRAFGSGASVCPGRYLALNEIVSILVMMVMNYDIEPVNGTWLIPKGVPHITKSILTPDKDIRVVFREREETKDAKWTFYWDSCEANSSPRKRSYNVL